MYMYMYEHAKYLLHKYIYMYAVGCASVSMIYNITMQDKILLKHFLCYSYYTLHQMLRKLLCLGKLFIDVLDIVNILVNNCMYIYMQTV